MLYKLYWQNRANHKQTKMVAEENFDDPKKLHAWIKELIERRENEMPRGWCAMFCSPWFVMTAIEKSVQTDAGFDGKA